jgi:hypothetical protein
MFYGLFSQERPFDVAPVADLVIRCHKGMCLFPWNWLRICRCMGFWFAHRFAQGFAYTIWRKSAPYSWNCRKKILGVERIRLDQHAL